ncbi:MAG: UDP-3-O-(3-hydroxymyristoyl)glucosamine N-acyltransferase [Chthonomonadales bacterium]|nr:UDP-3-O-(3-hydroxymyristoyl)glucosamine N-acyltransferase [Chthonomonadales bacterium]
MFQAATHSTPQESAEERAITLGELAERVQGLLQGDGTARIRGVASIEEAESGDIVFAENQRFLARAERSRASAIVAFLEATTPDKPLIKVDDPRNAFARILEWFTPPLNAPVGVHPTAVLGANVELGADVSIGPHVVVGDRARIGRASVLLAGGFLGDDSVLGERCVLHPNVTVYAGVTLGDRVTLHAGAVIGADGFGYTRIGDRFVKVPQIGTVEIGDDVEIGANSTIDRAKTGATAVGARTKIDNLVHIAHNVKVGLDCVITAQVGVAGSSRIGSRVILAGQAGVKDHVTVEDGAIVMAQAGVFGDIAAGSMVSGCPARPHRNRLRQDAAAANLPEYVKRIRALERQNAILGKRLAEIEVALAHALAGMRREETR